MLHPVSALPLGRCVTCVSQRGAPAHCAGRAHSEPGGGFPPRRTLIDGLDDPVAKVHRKRSRHPCRPPVPTGSGNHCSPILGIPYNPIYIVSTSRIPQSFPRPLLHDRPCGYKPAEYNATNPVSQNLNKYNHQSRQHSHSNSAPQVS